MAQGQINKATEALGSITGAGAVLSGDKSVKVEHSIDKSINTTIYILIGGVILAILIYKFT